MKKRIYFTLGNRGWVEILKRKEIKFLTFKWLNKFNESQNYKEINIPKFFSIWAIKRKINTPSLMLYKKINNKNLK